MQAINVSLSKVNVSKAAKPIKPYKHERILPLLISPLLAPRPYRNCILILTLRPHHNSSAHSLKTLRQGLGQGWGAKGDMARAVRGSNKMTLLFKGFTNAAVVRTLTFKDVDCCVRSKSWNNWIKSWVSWSDVLHVVICFTKRWTLLHRSAWMTLKDALSVIVFTCALHQIWHETPNI